MAGIRLNAKTLACVHLSQPQRMLGKFAPLFREVDHSGSPSFRPIPMKSLLTLGMALAATLLFSSCYHHYPHHGHDHGRRDFNRERHHWKKHHHDHHDHH